MADILRPDRNSRENIALFLNTIQDEKLKSLLESNLDHILAIGSNQDTGRTHRDSFFKAFETMLEEQTEQDT